jgi:methylglyoxal synthase
MNFELVAHRLHRFGSDSGLLRWARAREPGLRALGLQLHATGGAHDALFKHRVLGEQLQSVGSGREGGLMRLVSRVAGGLTPADALEAKPLFALESQVLALIAHDARKDQMVAFAAEHFDILSRFSERVATGTTGSRLNDMAWARGWPAGQTCVTCFQSGPLGGDAQIAELAPDRRCRKVVFFEDPHVARQHEADIQLLERAVASASETTTCFNTPAMAGRWAQAVRVVMKSK